MAIKHEGRCSICKSPYRAEIEEFVHKNKPRMSWTEITKHIQENFGITTGMSSIWTHSRSHANISEEVFSAYASKRAEKAVVVPVGISADQINASIAIAETAVRDNVAEISRLDEIIDRDFETYVKVSDELNAQLNRNGQVERNLVELLKVLNNNINSTMKTRMEMLGDDPGSRQAAAMETWIDLMRDVQ